MVVHNNKDLSNLHGESQEKTLTLPSLNIQEETS